MTLLAYHSGSVQRLRRLAHRRAFRQEQRALVVEGHKLIAEALAAHVGIEVVYLDPARAGDSERDVAARAAEAGARVLEVQPGVLDRACDAVTPQPVAAVVAAVDVPLADLAARRPRPAPVVICAGLQDPGNAGTILRIAVGSGVGAVVFCAGSVDLYNPKTVRSSAGALFHVPVVAGAPAEDVLDEVGRWGLRRWGTIAEGGCDYTEADLDAPSALVFGNEAHGLPAGLEGRLDGLLTVPLEGGAESLNVATAAAVLCFDAARRRRARLAATGGAGAR